ncbi:hypothetical protein RCO48_03010 [Peribacillus frigoritolerans]|nr:hypothetical protein [Peribacillus frigoritolerans]
MKNGKKQLLTKWEPEATIKGSLQQIQQEALDFVEDEHFMDTYLTPMIHHILDNIKENSSHIDHWIQKQITVLIEKKSYANRQSCTRKT